MSATVNFYFDGRMSKEDEFYVKYAIYHDGKQKYYSTGLKLDKKDTEFLKKYKGGLTGGVRDPYLRNLWHMLYGESYVDDLTGEEKVAYIKKAETVIANLGSKFTFKDFSIKIKNDSSPSVTAKKNDVVHDLFAKGNSLKNEDKLSTGQLYILTAKSLIRFNKGNEQLSYFDVDKSFLKAYEKWMLREGKLAKKKDKPNTPASITTVSMYIRTIRSVFNDNQIPAEYYPFGKGGYTVPKHRNIKKSLTIEDIGKILSVRLEPRSMREMSRDLWIFSYLSNGLNFADILNLKNADYDRKNKTIVFIRQKTSNAKTGSVSKIQIDLNPVTTSIIENWGNPAGEYVFPIFDATMSVARKKAVCAQVTKNTNYNMKVVATELEINTDVKTYAARHSFATILLRSEAPLAFISQKLGHSSIKTTQDYLGSFEDEKVKKYLSALIPESKEAQKEAEEG